MTPPMMTKKMKERASSRVWKPFLICLKLCFVRSQQLIRTTCLVPASRVGSRKQAEMLIRMPTEPPMKKDFYDQPRCVMTPPMK